MGAPASGAGPENGRECPRDVLEELMHACRVPEGAREAYRRRLSVALACEIGLAVGTALKTTQDARRD